MKLFKILLAAFTVSILFTNCKKVLQKQDLQSLTPAEVFNDSTVTKSYMDLIYTNNLPSWGGNTGGAIGTGETLTDEEAGSNVYMQGLVTQETVGDISTSNSKSTNYGKIRNCNDFITGVTAGTLPIGTKNRYKAQAYFWRAYRYFDLVRLYGGVPLVLTTLPEVGDAARADALLPRNTTSQCINQIVSDLDTAIKYLPAKWPQAADYARITSAAAASFLGRVLLTYASPQFNPTNDQTRWMAAYNANVQANTILKANGYGLAPSYSNMWFVEGDYANPEAVMVTAYNTYSDANGMDNNSYDTQTRPAYLGTAGGSNQPTWNLVANYDMQDGLPPGTSPKYPYSINTYYDNRDPRFAATIAYNGCNWPILGNTAYRLWTYIYYTNAAGTATKSTESTASTTGFYTRKAIDPNVSLSNVVYEGTDWMEIRYAEVLLNLGECAAEIGNLGVAQEAYTGLIAIRKRAGIDAGTAGLYGLTPNMTHDQMITAIMHERQIEFAIEGKRYWDLRRRKLLESTLNGTPLRKGIVTTLNNTKLGTDYILTTRDASANTSLDAMYTANFTITLKTLDTYNIAVQSADYFFGIPTAALTNNPNLIQNNTWGGAFDPLQ